MGLFIISELAAVLETFRHDFHFPGHILPGTAFFLMGVWWTWNTFKIHNKNEQNKNFDDVLNQENLLEKSYQVHDSTVFSATYNREMAGIWYCEGFYKIVYASFDLLGHFLVVVYGGEITDERQHMTVYVFFIVNGIFDLFLHSKLYKIPDGADYLTSSIAWAAFGYLFLSHKHAKTPISIFYHQILGWLATAVAGVTLMQYKYEKNTLVAIIRGSCCILTGTWLYQIAFSFHNPFIAANQYRNRIHGGRFDEVKCCDTNVTTSDQMEIMEAVTTSTWHVLLVGAVVVVLGHDFHFPGHLLPGTAFILIGIWWLWNTLEIHNKNEQRRNTHDILCQEILLDKSHHVHDSSAFGATYNGDMAGFWYCEGFYKIVYASFDLFGHFLVVLYGGEMTDERQHMTVYIFFIVNGIVDLSIHLKLIEIPDGTDYLTASIAWAAFGYLFLSHKHAKTPISIFYHQILGWLAIAVAAVTLMQYKYEKNTLVAMIRGSCCILTGTWLYQIAFSFHNPFIAANQYRNRETIAETFDEVNLKM
ncbi:Transmembrane protein, partial [Pseudolycoriella hygida]